MKALTPEVNELLNKLYNLRGEDSVILVEMEKQRKKAEETKTRTTEEKKDLQRKIAELEELHEELDEQGEKLKNVLSGINRNDYQTVLERLKIDFNPTALVEKLENSLPRTIETVKMDTQKAEEELVKVEEEMNTAITTIEEVGIRKDAALGNQAKLNEYFELALTGRINITRDSITSLLEQFSFTEEEQREAAKILMFPEDSLFIYDERLKNKERSGKSMSEVFAEAKTASYEPEPIIEEKIKEQPEEIIEEKRIDPKEEVISILKGEDIDYLNFRVDELEELINNFDRDLFLNNINLIKAKGLGIDLINTNIKLLYDKELNDKIDILLNNGKEITDLYINPNVLIKYTKEDLLASIDNMKISGLEPREVPLMAY